MLKYEKFCTSSESLAQKIASVLRQTQRLNVKSLYFLQFQPCDVSSPELMDCLTPKVVVPGAFEGYDTGLESAENRRRRSVDSFDHSSPNKPEVKMYDENYLARRYPRSVEREADQTLLAGNELLDFYLGFKLDGVQSYKNLSDTKDMVDYAKFSFVSEVPEISVIDFKPFVPYSGAKIRIKVKLMFHSLSILLVHVSLVVKADSLHSWVCIKCLFLYKRS